MLLFNFHQRVKEATRVTQSCSKCIDLVFTNFSSSGSILGVQDFGFSDHKSVLLKIPIISPNLQNLTVLKRLYNTKNNLRFRNEIASIDWNSLFSYNNNVNENYNKFTTTLELTLKACIPRRVVKIKLKQKKTYLTPGLKTSCHNKRLLKLLVSQTKSEVLRCHYRQYCKILRKAITKSKKINNTYRLDKSSNKSQTMWKIINSELNKNRRICKNNVQIKTSDEKILHDPIHIANTFNKFFSEIGNSHLSSRNSMPVTDSIDKSFFLSPVEPNEVNLIIKNLKNKKSFGIDEFPPL